MAEIDQEPVENRVLRLEEGMKGLRQDVTAIRDMLTESSTTQKGERRHAWAMAISVAALVGAPLAFFLNISIESKVSPLAAASAASVKEREGLLRVQESNVTRIGDMERIMASALATITARMAEIEGQTDAAAQLENQRMAEVHRMISISWPRDRLGDYPIMPFPLPNVSNRQGLPHPGK